MSNQPDDLDDFVAEAQAFLDEDATRRKQSGPAKYGGRDLTHAHDLVYDLVEADYDVPDTGILSVIGLGMIGPKPRIRSTHQHRPAAAGARIDAGGKTPTDDQPAW